MDITSKSPASSRLNPCTPKTCDAFAKAALGEVFRARDLCLAREPDFVDHLPNQQPRRLGEIANKIVAGSGERAVHHWLDEATQAETQQKRAAALVSAQKVAKALGLTLEDFLFGRAA
jgi:hypothetical protein